MGQNQSATNLLIGIFRIYVEVDSQFDGFVKFGCVHLFQDVDCFRHVILFVFINQFGGFRVFLAYFCHLTFPPLWFSGD